MVNSDVMTSQISNLHVLRTRPSVPRAQSPASKQPGYHTTPRILWLHRPMSCQGGLFGRPSRPLRPTRPTRQIAPRYLRSPPPLSPIALSLCPRRSVSHCRSVPVVLSCSVALSLSLRVPLSLYSRPPTLTACASARAMLHEKAIILGERGRKKFENATQVFKTWVGTGTCAALRSPLRFIEFYPGFKPR